MHHNIVMCPTVGEYLWVFPKFWWLETALRYMWDSLVTQTVKNLPEMQETWVWSLDQEDPLEKEMVTHLPEVTHSCLENPMGRGARQV